MKEERVDSVERNKEIARKCRYSVEWKTSMDEMKMKRKKKYYGYEERKWGKEEEEGKEGER